MKAAGPNSSRPQVRLARFMYRYFAADRDRVRTGSTARHPAGPLYERAELPGLCCNAHNRQRPNAMEEKILNLLTQPMKTGEVAEATGIEKKEVEKIIKKLVKEGKVESPKRCYYAAVK